MLLRRQGANRQVRWESHGRYRENFDRSVFSHRNFPAFAMGTLVIGVNLFADGIRQSLQLPEDRGEK